MGFIEGPGKVPFRATVIDRFEGENVWEGKLAESSVLRNAAPKRLVVTRPSEREPNCHRNAEPYTTEVRRVFGCLTHSCLDFGPRPRIGDIPADSFKRAFAFAIFLLNLHEVGRGDGFHFLVLGTQ